MKIEDQIPEGFELARLAKPSTKEAELRHGERRLSVDVIVRPKQPRRWIVEEKAGFSHLPGFGALNWIDSLGVNVRIVREIPQECEITGAQLDRHGSEEDTRMPSWDEIRRMVGTPGEIIPSRTSAHANDETCVCGHRRGFHTVGKGQCEFSDDCFCGHFKSSETGQA